MRGADRVAAVLLLALAAGYGAVAIRDYAYWDANGPGSGFLPVWLAAALAGLGGLLLVSAVRARDPGPAPVPRGHGAVRLGAVLAATVALVALLPVLGMATGTALFLAVLLRGLERHSWPVTLGVAVGTAAVNWAVFTWWLRVPFPTGVLGF